MVRSPQFEVLKDFYQAYSTGREIVPLLGAGISIESGIPALASLAQYLAKVQRYIALGGIFSSPSQRRLGAAAPNVRKQYDKPSQYLQDFGWPDPFQLNAELWRWIDEDEANSPVHRDLLERKIQEELPTDMRRTDERLGGRLSAGRLSGINF